MYRKEFLSKLSMGAAFALTVGCFGSCKKEEDQTQATLVDDSVDFTIDITDPTNGNLLNNGGFIFNGSVIVAKDVNGNYVAATKVCSHENLPDIVFRNNEWFCPAHDARFNINGQGQNDKGKRNLLVYNTELNGDLLRVYS